MAKASPKAASAVAAVFSIHRFVALSFGVLLFAFPAELNEAMAPSKVMVFEEKFSLQVRRHAWHHVTSLEPPTTNHQPPTWTTSIILCRILGPSLNHAAPPVTSHLATPRT